MRKIILILTVFTMMCQTTVVLAENDSEMTSHASFNAEMKNLIIEGQINNSDNDGIFILVTDKSAEPEALTEENIHYIDMCRTDENGVYRTKFKLGTEDVDSLKIVVKQNLSDVTYTLNSAIVEKKMILNAYYSNGKIYANMSNMYTDEMDFVLITAAYDKNGRLISAVENNEQISYDDFSKNISFDYIMPQNAHTYKIMAWSSLDMLKPLADACEKYNYNANAQVLDVYTDDDIKETADKLFININPESEDIKYIYEEYTNGNYLNALALLRNYMIDNLRAIPADIEGCAWNDTYNSTVNLNLLDTMVGYMTLDEANAGVRTTVDAVNMLDYIDSDQPSGLEWIICDKELPAGGTLLLDNLRHGFTGLAIRYMQTGDAVYAKKLVQLMEDYGMNYQPQSDEHFGLTNIPLEDRDMRSIDSQSHTDYNDILVINNYGARADSYNVSKAQRANSFFYAMSFMAKALPSEEHEHNYSNIYPSELSVMSFDDRLSDDSYNIIDPVRWARWINHLAEWEFPSLCGSVLNCSGGTTNITSSAYQASLRYMALLKDFTVIDEYREQLFDAVNIFYEGNTHKDGAYIETAFAYNISEAANRTVTANVISRIADEWYDEIYNFSSNAEKWERVVKISTSPLGLLSHVGNYYGAMGTPAIWTDVQKKSDFEQQLDIQPEEYTSAYLPYSGIGSFREGWGIDDLYMSFFVNKDRYSGHGFAATNSVLNLTAYGRTMLISGGTPWYGRDYVKTYTDFLENGYDEINGYMGENSTRKVSTVMVNGKSQEDRAYEFDENGVTSTYGTALSTAKDETLPGIWVSDTEFDFAEGVYDNAYTIRDTTAEIIPQLPDVSAITKDAVHNRGFVFVKNAGLWIITDEMTNTNNETNTYSAMWHLAAYEEGNKNLTGFKNEQVIIDENKNEFYTNDTGKLNYDTPNLFVYNFSPKKLSYKKYYGEYTKGERQAFGWSYGGINTLTGKYAKRPEVHVEWTDEKGAVSQLTTLLVPSPDDNTRVSYKVDNSYDNTTSFEIGMTDGYIVTYNSNPYKTEVKIGDDIIKAKTVITVQKNAISPVSGIVIECESINGTEDGTSFTFDVDSKHIVKRKNVERPVN